MATRKNPAKLASRYEVQIETWTNPQMEFWRCAAQHRLFLGGVGSGKTRAGVVECWRQPPRSVGVVIAPTYRLLHDVTEKAFLTLSEQVGILKEYRAGDREATLVNGTNVLFRSGDDPEKLVGTNIGWFWLDESDRMSVDVWYTMCGRYRLEPGRAWCTTSPGPEGTAAWGNAMFPKGGRVGVGGVVDFQRIVSRTHDNVFNRQGYVEGLEQQYSELWRRRDLEGEYLDIEGANLFDVGKLKYCNRGDVPDGLHKVRSWDIGFKIDPTAGVRMEGPSPDGLVYIVDVQCFTMEPSERDRRCRATAEQDGGDVKIRFQQDMGGSGWQVAEEFKKLMLGFSFECVPTVGAAKKHIRADPFASAVNAGRVVLVRGQWNAEFAQELDRFGRGGHDDQVDAASDAFIALAQRKTPARARVA